MDWKVRAIFLITIEDSVHLQFIEEGREEADHSVILKHQGKEEKISS